MIGSSTARRLSALVMVGALGLAACGSSGGAASSEGGAATTAAASSDASTKASDATATSADTTAASSGGSSGGSSGDMGKAMVAAFKALEKGDCGKATSLVDSFDVSDAAFSGGQALETFGELGKALEKLADDGPSELRADFATMAKGMTAMGELFKELDLSDPTKMAEVMKDPAKAAKFEELGKTLDSAEFTGASERISAWIDSKCPELNKG